jgi:enoyl-[acyl-carrier-protein] reductase (NADH)
MPIDALPTAPSTSDPANFDSRADVFVAALPTLVTQINATVDTMNTQAATVDAQYTAVGVAKTAIDAARADVTAKAAQVTIDKNAAAASAAAAAASAAAAAGFDPSGYLLKADNLNSVTNKPQARVNLGLRIGTRAIFVAGDDLSSMVDGDIYVG